MSTIHDGPDDYSPVSFEPKHGTAERWNVCDCIDCRRATSRPLAPAIRHDLAVLLKRAADKADEWRAAAIAEWTPLSPDYHAGDGTVTAEVEGPYIEHRLSMSVGKDVRRLADLLSADKPYLISDLQ